MRKFTAIALSLLIPALSQAAVQIVVLNVSDAGSNKVQYNYLCWLNAPNPLPNPSFVSQWKALGSSAGPTTAQIAALQNGTVIEQTGALQEPTITPLATVESDIINDCTARQNYINGIPGQGIYYGVTWNGSQWVQQ